ncbi:MAG: hypothetical protein AM1032_000036 [Mycoplasmataceae bacterium]|nr:MAG: hypothetical protein AM1032_000036 [Mycoplasmataceae bacterium]
MKKLKILLKENKKDFCIKGIFDIGEYEIDLNENYNLERINASNCEHLKKIELSLENNVEEISLINLPNLKFFNLESLNRNNFTSIIFKNVDLELNTELFNNFTNLFQLVLKGYNIKGSLSHLGSLSKLWFLNISNTSITGSLISLRNLKELKELYVQNTNIIYNFEMLDENVSVCSSLKKGSINKSFSINNFLTFNENPFFRKRLFLEDEFFNSSFFKISYLKKLHPSLFENIKEIKDSADIDDLLLLIDLDINLNLIYNENLREMKNIDNEKEYDLFDGLSLLFSLDTNLTHYHNNKNENCLNGNNVKEVKDINYSEFDDLFLITDLDDDKNLYNINIEAREKEKFYENALRFNLVYREVLTFFLWENKDLISLKDNLNYHKNYYKRLLEEEIFITQLIEQNYN